MLAPFSLTPSVSSAFTGVHRNPHLRPGPALGGSGSNKRAARTDAVQGQRMRTSPSSWVPFQKGGNTEVSAGPEARKVMRNSENERTTLPFAT